MIFQVTLSQPIYCSFLSVSSFCLFQVLIFAFLPVGEKWINSNFSWWVNQLREKLSALAGYFYCLMFQAQ